MALAVIAIAALPLLLSGCDRLSWKLNNAKVVAHPPPPDSVLFPPDSATLARAAAVAESAAAENRVGTRFSPYVIHDAHVLGRLRRALGEAGLATALKVSRFDLDHIHAGDTLVVPDRPESLLALSPFPAELPAARGFPRLLFVSLRVQAFGAYQNGKLARWGPTSSGRRDMPTPRGLYYTNWKAKERVSTIDSLWQLKWVVNLESREGINVHQYGLPGRPASHSCVRLAEDDAAWLYAWVSRWRVAVDRRTILRRGTPVLVFGAYAFGERRPWNRLIDDPRSTRYTRQALADTLTSWLLCGPPAPDSTIAGR
jgi:hypothetical protein